MGGRAYETEKRHKNRENLRYISLEELAVSGYISYAEKIKRRG